MNVRSLASTLLPLLAVCSILTTTARAASLYSQNFDSFPSATGSVDGWWNYFGPSNTTAAFGVDNNGVNGSQALYLTCDASGEINTDWYFYAGIGRSSIGTPASVMPAARDQDVQFTISLMASNANDTGAVSFELSQWNEAQNGNTFARIWTPTLDPSGYTTVTVTLNTGTDDPQGTIGGAPSVFDPNLPISLGAVTFNSGHFPLASNVGVHIDNVSLSTLIDGDANGDGKVDLTDLSIVLNHFGANSNLRTDGNFDSAPAINLTDLSLVLNNFGTSASPAAASVAVAPVSAPAPEPASLSLLAAAGALLLRRRSPRQN
ncbi:MAG: PEP-CTERM sorting domain-containing protein [Phycisphaerae bacterium]